MEKLSNKILQKIKEEKIEPKPRWQFLLKNYAFWAAFGVSVIIGGLAFCVVLGILVDNDWDIYRLAAENPGKKIFLSLPFLWILALVLFLAAAFYYCKRTKCGYRYEVYSIIGLSILGSVILGSIFHFSFGMGREMEALVAEKVPYYQKFYSPCNDRILWLQPEKGLLAGEIIKISSPNSFDLKDFNDSFWVVKKDEDTFVLENEPLFEEEEVRIIGKQEEEKVFRAKEIRPWKKKCPVAEKGK
jgi:hypothetical protein